MLIPISMKSSTTNSYIFFPDNSALDRAVEHAATLLAGTAGDEESGEPAIVRSVGDSDPRQKNTLGNFEHSHYTLTVLDTARTCLEGALTDELRHQAPAEWAATKESLGAVLATLGQARGDAALIEQAIDAFNNALEVGSQDDTPLDWAVRQNNLGLALQALGREQQDSKSFKRSVDAFTNALTAWTREQAPQQWALAMHHLGTTFYLQGESLKGNRSLQKSDVAYKNALTEFNADNDPLEYAISYANRGAVLQSLAKSEQNPEQVEEALRSYETALTVMEEQQLPIHLPVMTRINIASARNLLTELSSDVAAAQEAADELEMIVAAFGDVGHPDCIKRAEEQLVRAEELANAKA